MPLIKNDGTLKEEVSVPSAPIVKSEIREGRGLSTLDKRIMYQGAIQKAVVSQALFTFSTSFEEWWKLAELTADKMVNYIEERSTK